MRKRRSGVTELDRRLQRAFAADAAPAADPLFRVQVILRRQRAALRRQLAEAFGGLCLCALLAALVLQSLDEPAGAIKLRFTVATLLAMGTGALLVHRYLEVPWLGHLMSAKVRSIIGRCWDDWKSRF
jgi:hypothetical protein